MLDKTNLSSFSQINRFLDSASTKVGEKSDPNVKIGRAGSRQFISGEQTFKMNELVKHIEKQAIFALNSKDPAKLEDLKKYFNNVLTKAISLDHTGEAKYKNEAGKIQQLLRSFTSKLGQIFYNREKKYSEMDPKAMDEKVKSAVEDLKNIVEPLKNEKEEELGESKDPKKKEVKKAVTDSKIKPRELKDEKKEVLKKTSKELRTVDTNIDSSEENKEAGNKELAKLFTGDFLNAAKTSLATLKNVDLQTFQARIAGIQGKLAAAQTKGAKNKIPEKLVFNDNNEVQNLVNRLGDMGKPLEHIQLIPVAEKGFSIQY